MDKNRLEAFSDGVIAVIITIMVLEIKVPHEVSFDALFKLLPVFISYVISFMYVGIYWNNHHHLFKSVRQINGQVLWANLFLLFCLSLIPFASGWTGENHFQELTVTLYGVVLLSCAFAYIVLTNCLLKIHDQTSLIHKAVGNKFKERMSLVFYIVGIGFSCIFPKISFLVYAGVALWWLIPDVRIEREIHE
jgi:uncharacterized membrane protein